MTGEERERPGPAGISWPADTPDGWLHVGPAAAREQGWKLHVSATTMSAPAVLARVLPILRTAEVAFKVAANAGCLGELNEGLGGFSQVGKFITIYPTDDDEAVRLAVALDRATAGLPGPRVPSDRPLRPGSLVHYRFGGFGDLTLTDTLGQTVPALRDPSGALTPDRRLTRFERPAWAADPFDAAGIVQHRPEPESSLFAGYVVLAVLHQHAKGGVFLAIDPRTTPPRPVIIKEGRQHLMADVAGRDAVERVQHQYALLNAFAPDASLPRAFELFECEGNAYLVMEYIDGSSVDGLVSDRSREGRRVSAEEIVTIGVGIAEGVARLHNRGYVLRDVTPSNVLVTPEPRVVLVDLELAQRVDDENRAFGWGTRGYVAPEQAAGLAPCPVQDIYGLGATLYTMATGCTPALLPNGGAARRRALRLLNPSISPRLRDAIGVCMDPDPARRPADMAEAARRLAASRGPAAAAARASGRLPAHPWGRRARFLDRARRCGDRLLATAERRPAGLCWRTSKPSRDEVVIPQHLARRGTCERYLHTGTAGVALFLADLAAATGDEPYAAAAVDAARWLLDPANAARTRLPGLYFGEAGVAAVVARIAQVTGRAGHLAAAADMLRTLTPACTNIPDVTHGWAGIGLTHLALHAITGDDRHLEAATAFGDTLAGSAERADAGIAWRQPAGPHEGLSGTVLTGFAHGVAGMAYFLLELAHATGERRSRDLAEQAATWLIGKAEPCLADGDGLNWPLGGDGSERWFHWCHGAAGVGLFFVRAWTLTGNPEYRRVATAAARTIAEAGYRGGTTLCHGLAGNGDFLLEAALVLEEPRWFAAARRIANLLELYAQKSDAGLAWPGDHADVITPDYMAGYSGVGAFMLRMADPERVGSPLLLPMSWRRPAARVEPARASVVHAGKA